MVLPKIRWRFGAGCVLALFLAACSVPEETIDPESTVQMDAGRIMAHTAFLADDLLEGREAGTRGEALAALYIRAQFEAAGLEPAGNSDSYFQRFPVRAMHLDRKSVQFKISGPKGETAFANGGDIAVFGDFLNPDLIAAGSVVFAGSGIVAPEFGIDDYAGLDVKGKIAAVLGGPPAFLPVAEAAHYGSSAQQRQTAEAQGAVGLVILWTPALEQRWQFDRFGSILDRTEMNWIGPDAVPNVVAPGIRLYAHVRGTAADALFADTPTTIGSLIEEAKTRSPKGFQLKTIVSLARKSNHDDGLSAINVGGLLTGSDPNLRDEVVVVTAHYDHIGIGAPVDGDEIYNGAGDNALGTAILIELAREISLMTVRPKRSILFLAVSAEEKGLIGSDYFAEHPTVPGSQIVANVNIDGALTYFDFSDVIAFGGEHSELHQLLTDAASEIGVTVASDPFPEEGIFTRSDQYSFARRGIPAVFLFSGFTSIDGENIGRAIWDEMTTTLLHMPTDDLEHQKFDGPATAKFADIARRFTLAIATAEEAPRWYDDSMVGTLFAPSAAKASRPD